MKISYNWLQSFFKQKLPAPEKLAEILTMHSFEAERVEKKGNDWVLEIDVLPNRAHDCLSHLGVARECAALLNTKFFLFPSKIQNTKYQLQNFLKVEVQDKNLCPRYCAKVIKNVKVGPSPKWLKERLEIIGQKSINNIVDATNYVMFETGQPLHAFDMGKVRGEIIVRRAKKGEKITTLDNEKYDLDENILVIADIKEPIAIAGIKGGKKAEISSATKNIILESAIFSSANIRQTSKKLGLRTEASLRFERGFDYNLAPQAINRVAGLIQELACPQSPKAIAAGRRANGEIIQGTIDVYPHTKDFGVGVYLKKVKPKKIKLEIEKVKRLLGIEISLKEIRNILERLGTVLEGQSSARTVLQGLSLTVVIPTWRLDISIQEDLIEEIGRVFGYEKIPAQLPTVTLIPPERNESLVYENKIRDILVSAGLSEVYNYSFIGQKLTALCPAGLVELENPVSQEQRYLRPSLMPNLLKNIKDNLRFFDEVSLFEIGKVFQLTTNNKQQTTNNKQQTAVKEEKRLAGIFALKDKTQAAYEFYRLKGVIDSLLNKLRISDVWYDDADSKQQTANNKQLYHSFRRAEIKIGDDSIGWLGEINPEILEKSSIHPHTKIFGVGVKTGAAGFEIDLERLVKLAAEEQIYRPPSEYPAVIRDVAVLVEPNTKVEEVLSLIETAGGPLVQDVDLFDIYEGEEIPDNKKNLAFHIIYQAEDRTLTDKEVNDLQAKIIWTLENEGGWEVRK